MPNMSLNPPPTIKRDYPTLSNTTSVRFGEFLDMDGGNLPHFDGTNRPDMSEMSLDSLLRERMWYLGKFTMSTSDPAGRILHTFDLGPCSELFTAGLGDTLTLSGFSYFCLPFTLWRGGIKIKLVSVGTAYHTGQVYVTSQFGYEAKGLTPTEVLNQNASLMVVGGIREQTFTFPWRSPTEWKRVNNGSNQNAMRYSMGQGSVVVCNPLTAPETVSTSITFRVYIGGSDDFEVASIGSNLIDYLPNPVTVPGKASRGRRDAKNAGQQPAVQPVRRRVKKEPVETKC